MTQQNRLLLLFPLHLSRMIAIVILLCRRVGLASIPPRSEFRLFHVPLLLGGRSAGGGGDSFRRRRWGARGRRWRLFFLAFVLVELIVLRWGSVGFWVLCVHLVGVEGPWIGVSGSEACPQALGCFDLREYRREEGESKGRIRVVRRLVRRKTPRTRQGKETDIRLVLSSQQCPPTCSLVGASPRRPPPTLPSLHRSQAPSPHSRP
jgi:hypothetical protein